MSILWKVLAFVMVGAASVGAGVHLWSSQAAEARLNQTWPAVVGKDLEVPTPLSETEVETLRQSLLNAGLDHAGQPLGMTQDADGEDVAMDPLQGADMDAIAMAHAIERGKHLYNVRLSCRECHGEDLGGRQVVDAQPVWTWVAPNISPGGVTQAYTNADWDRIIRHGVKPDDTNATMPAIDYMALSDREVSDVIAYAKSMPPLDHVQPATVLGPVGRLLLATGKMPIAAEEVDHDYESELTPPAVAETEEYGKHIAQVCVGCHRLEFEGGPIAAGPPEWPPAANLTADSFKSWSESDFMSAIRTGVRPDGSLLNAEAMPWPVISQWTDLELRAVYLYLQTLPPVPTGT